MELLLKIVKENPNINIKVDSAFTPFLMLSTNGMVSENQSGCGALSKFINITVSGKFKPCSHISLEEKCESIFDYYTNSNNKKILDSLEIIENSSCINCDFNKKCFGCLAITFDKCGIIAKGEVDCKIAKLKGRKNV